MIAAKLLGVFFFSLNLVVCFAVAGLVFWLVRGVLVRFGFDEGLAGMLAAALALYGLLGVIYG